MVSITTSEIRVITHLLKKSLIDNTIKNGEAEEVRCILNKFEALEQRDAMYGNGIEGGEY